MHQDIVPRQKKALLVLPIGPSSSLLLIVVQLWTWQYNTHLYVFHVLDLHKNTFWTKLRQINAVYYQTATKDQFITNEINIHQWSFLCSLKIKMYSRARHWREDFDKKYWLKDAQVCVSRKIVQKFIQNVWILWNCRTQTKDLILTSKIQPLSAMKLMTLFIVKIQRRI